MGERVQCELVLSTRPAHQDPFHHFRYAAHVIVVDLFILPCVHAPFRLAGYVEPDGSPGRIDLAHSPDSPRSQPGPAQPGSRRLGGRVGRFKREKARGGSTASDPAGPAIRTPGRAGCETLSEMSIRRHGADVQQIPSIIPEDDGHYGTSLPFVWPVSDSAAHIPRPVRPVRFPAAQLPSCPKRKAERGQPSGSSKAKLVDRTGSHVLGCDNQGNATLRHAEARTSECHPAPSPGTATPAAVLNQCKQPAPVLGAQIILAQWLFECSQRLKPTPAAHDSEPLGRARRTSIRTRGFASFWKR
ncbi:hypothetical protein CH63R_12737 [Colletotrichum higginsianum IMI 349063]|uniref:Uncharacterized protein n=1 Tax=Colletotrichum higginsianum (strain IMI 349063) TaxID=759273 RepID=A0A1B7XV43_COLHI|nr:hypothetical protein CH63R_12737 [Colletotrichum higginsianum IMI 349063]OBR03610.1 hypothetical protein CH63R_12737 [Colletotrichum higginsianum IMI 349063]